MPRLRHECNDCRLTTKSFARIPKRWPFKHAVTVRVDDANLTPKIMTCVRPASQNLVNVTFALMISSGTTTTRSRRAYWHCVWDSDLSYLRGEHVRLDQYIKLILCYTWSVWQQITLSEGLPTRSAKLDREAAEGSFLCTWPGRSLTRVLILHFTPYTYNYI